MDQLQTTSTALPFWREVGYGSGDVNAASTVVSSTSRSPLTVVIIFLAVLTNTY